MLLIGVVKVAGKAPLAPNGKSIGTVPCALILDALAADSIAASEKVVITVETNVVTKEVLEGEPKGTSGHIEDVAALIDPCGRVNILTHDLKVGTLPDLNPVKAALRHDNERGHLNKARETVCATVVKQLSQDITHEKSPWPFWNSPPHPFSLSFTALNYNRTKQTAAKIAARYAKQEENRMEARDISRRNPQPRKRNTDTIEHDKHSKRIKLTPRETHNLARYRLPR